MNDIVSEIHDLAERTAEYLGGGHTLAKRIERDLDSKEQFMSGWSARGRHFDQAALKWRNTIVKKLRTKLHKIGLLDAA